MLVFIDESGDPGFRFGEGSSERFVVTAVILLCPEDANTTEDRIRAVRQKLGLRKGYEFHYSHSSPKILDAFFQEMAHGHFLYSSLVVHKTKLEAGSLNSDQKFWSYASNMLLDSLGTSLNDAKIAIDGGGGRNFKQGVATEIRQRQNGGGVKRVRKVVFQDSGKNDLIQLADMVCGAVGRSFSSKAEPNKHRKLLKALELDVGELPEHERAPAYPSRASTPFKGTFRRGA